MNIVIITCIITALSGVGATFVLAFAFRSALTRQQLEHEQEIMALKEQLRCALSDKAAQPRMHALQDLRAELAAARSQILSSSPGRDYERKLKNAYYEILHLHSFTGFCATMNGRLFGIVDRLKQLYPSLSEQHYELLVLYLLDLSPEDIALVMNYQINSMPNTKVRLAHKIHLSSGLELQPRLLEIFCKSR